MDRELIREALYNKYIEPTKKLRENYIGIEIEMPILNMNKEAVDFLIIHEMTKKFMNHFGFEAIGIDEDGNVYSAQNNKNGDILSYDCSYNNLELSFGVEKNLNLLDERFIEYYTFIQNELQKNNYTLTGMGVNPYRKYNNNVPIPSERYRMLFHYLNLCKKYKSKEIIFHNHPEYGTFSSASQVQLDVSYEDLIPTILAFSKLEPIKAYLFSNSILLGEDEELLCSRDMFWENSMHGLNPHNIGMFNCELESVEDLLSYIETTSIYCVERNGKYINFIPIKIVEYFEKELIEGEYYEDGHYKKIKFKPELEDIKYLRTFKFEDLTFRGTIEFRSVCCQPIRDRMTVAAFHLGLNSKVKELKYILDNDNVIYHRGYSEDELRKMFVKRYLPEFINKKDFKKLTKEILDLSEEGLKERGFGEEKYLKPLYERLEEGKNPAEKLLQLREDRVKIEDIILDYAKLI